MTLKRATLWGSLCAAAGFAPLVLGQIPCTDPQSIGCDYHPDYGWIVRGSAPKKEAPGPKSRTDELIEEYKSRPPPTPEELEREHKRQVDAEIQRTIDAANDQFYRQLATARRTVALLPKTGTCPAGTGVRAGASERESYHLTREACLISYSDACAALKDMCRGDPIVASDAGRCYFGPAHEWERTFAKPRSELLRELRGYESACLSGREAGPCTNAALSHTFAAIPEANPQNAYYYANLACKHGKPYQPVPSSRPEVLECTSKLTDCYIGAPPRPTSSYSMPSYATPAPAPRPQEPEGHCPFPKVTQATRDQFNAAPAEKRSKDLRQNEDDCLQRKDHAACYMAAMDHATLTVPEADPKKSWRFMTLACELDSIHCARKKEVCVAKQ